MLVLSVVDEEGRKIDVDFFVVSGLSCGFHDDLVCGGVDVLEIVLLENGIFIFHFVMEVLCRCLLVYFGDLILGFFVGGESGEGGGVVGRMMIGDSVISDGGRC